jgi:hypothetical protein
MTTQRYTAQVVLMRIELCTLPDLSMLPPLQFQGDPDGQLERAAFALLPGDVVGSCRLALCIRNPYRRAVWLRGFRKSTIAAACEAAHV